MIDSHAHLDFDAFDPDRAEVLARAREAGVEAIVDVGIDVASSRAAADLARSHPGLFASAGIHPTSKVAHEEAALAGIEALAREHPRRVVAVGEIGLDYYWKDVVPEVQRPRLERQLDLAAGLGLPVIIHCRDALDDLLSLLGSRPTLPAGVFHCFAGGPRDAQRVIALGFHVSFAGNVTYPKAKALQDAARAVPLGRLLLETDAPFLAPQARRGKRNEPAFARHTLEFLAALKGVGSAELESATTEAAVRLFALDPAWRLGLEAHPPPDPL